MRDYNVHEVLAILQKYYVTESQQMVTRWIREGKILATRSPERKEGYRIYEEDLYEFIEDQRPGLITIMDGYSQYIKSIQLDEVETEAELEAEPKAEPSIQDKEVEVFSKGIDKVQSHQKELEASINQLQEDFVEQRQNISEILVQVQSLINQSTEEGTKSLDHYEQNSTETKQEKREIKIMQLKDFKRIYNDIIKQLGVNLTDEEQENSIIFVYNSLYETDGQVKEELQSGEGNIKCPLTNKEYKQHKRLIRNLMVNEIESSTMSPILNK